ncbi:MAG: type 1 glutamine amidotransferase domain-containing protein, partial [Bdellovibrionota bacterium]
LKTYATALALMALSAVDPTKYSAVLYAGGHGTMWDFADSAQVQRIASGVYENDGIVAAVCHGPAALVNVKLSNGSYLVSGKRVTGFSNAEEEAAELTKVMPFLLETALIDHGAKFENAALWQKKVVTDGRLVTGQNPASAAGVGAAIAKILATK